MTDSKFLNQIESRPQNLNPDDRKNWQKFNASVDDLTPEFRKWLIDFFLVEVAPLIPEVQQKVTGASGGGFLEFSEEQSQDPDAPVANAARLFIKDSGAGKTQLAVRFNTGATQVIATEP